MAAIVRGTTPIIRFNFSDIRVSDIQVAYLVIKQGAQKLEKDITEATIDTNSIRWSLTQQETLGLSPRRDVTIVCDWRLGNGIRGRSEELTASVEEPGKNEVI